MDETTVNTSTQVHPFILSIPEEKLLDLKRRLESTRLPEIETGAPWAEGVPVNQMQRLIDYWTKHYDWRRCERMLNGLGQFRTQINGVWIHFLHVRSKNPNAIPLIMTHGWPGSVIEFCKTIGPLVDPQAHGGNTDDAFHVVIPSLPGYGFSDAPNPTWPLVDIAKAWTELMKRLSYDRYAVQGGDWGSGVAAELAVLAPEGMAAIHVNCPAAYPLPDEQLSEKEIASLAAFTKHNETGRGYAQIQGTRPQTLGYGLADSPVGQAAWIYEKFHAWSDCNGDPLSIFTMDEILDNIMLYWLPNRGATSARLYGMPFPADWLGLELPHMHSRKFGFGVSMFPKELYSPARVWLERRYGSLMHYNELERGGHFAAFEQPALFVKEMRDCFRTLR